MKYLITDLDDTLLTNHKTVSPYTMQVLKELSQKGFLLVFNTARSYPATLPLIEEIQPDYSIVNGGAQILRQKDTIYSKPIPLELTNYILSEIKQDKSILNFSVQGIHRLYTPDMSYVEANPLANYFSFREDFMEPAYKILLAAENKTKWIALAKEFGLQYESYLDGLWFRLSASTKELGNLELFKILKDTNPIDYVFGDDTGDLAMIQRAYHGVLLCNARTELKRQVQFITRWDNENDGVAKYMEEILKTEKI